MSWPTPLWSVLTSPGYPVVDGLSPITVAICGGGIEPAWYVYPVAYGSHGIEASPSLIDDYSHYLTANGNGSVCLWQNSRVDLRTPDRFIWAFYVSNTALENMGADTSLRLCLSNHATVPVFQPPYDGDTYFDIPGYKWSAGWNIAEVVKTGLQSALFWENIEAVYFQIVDPQESVGLTLRFENVYAFSRTAGYPVLEIYVRPGGDSGWELRSETAKIHVLGGVHDIIHDLGYRSEPRRWAGLIRTQHQNQNMRECVKELVILKGPKDAGSPAWCDSADAALVDDVSENIPKWQASMNFTRRDASHLA